MITERFQGTLQGTLRNPGTVAAPSAPVVRQNGPADYFNSSYTDRYGSYTDPKPGPAGASPSIGDIALGAFFDDGDKSKASQRYETSDDVRDQYVLAAKSAANKLTASLQSPTKAAPTAPMYKPQEDNNVDQPEQSVSSSDLTTSIGIDPAMQLFQSARNALTLSAPNMGLNFGSAVQGIAAAYALGRHIFSGTQPANPQTQLSIKPKVITNTKTASGGSNMGSNLLGSILTPPGGPGLPPKGEDDTKDKVLPPPTPLSNQSMKTDVFSPGEVGQMGGRTKAANPEEHNPRDRSNRFRQSTMFTITPDQAMNFIAKTESSDNSLKSLIREEIRRRIEEEVGKK
jgi:hypothetical protein